MAKKKTNGYVECPYIENCPADTPTRVAHLGWRFVYTSIAFAVLGLGASPGTGFFVSVLLFAGSLLLDYFKFLPDTPLRRVIRRIGIGYTGCFCTLGIFGLVGILTVISVQANLYVMVSSSYVVAKGASFPIEYIWYSAGIAAFLTGVDWVVYEGFLEKNYDSDTKASA